MDNPRLTDLITLVATHYQEGWTKPLLLSTLGQLLGDRRPGLVEEFGSLAGAIKATDGKLQLVVDPDNHVRVAVVTPEVRDAVAAALTPTTAGAATAFETLPRSLRIAFCLRTGQGEQIAVRLSQPVRYVRLLPGDQAPTGFFLVDDRFRIPGLDYDAATSAEKERLWANFLAWTSEQKLDADLLLKRQKPANALERLMAAQDPEVVSRLVLPGDIVAILLRHA